MIIELAPLEGLTTYAFRNACARHFGNIDKYYTPFLSLHKEKEFNHKERQEILPENNQGIQVVPQVLTNSAEDFLKAAMKLNALGYEEVNINFGCPSPTVTTKAKGAGMLAEPERLDSFLEEIFEQTCVKVSIKTRLGMESVNEWKRILEIYNKYPLQQLIIHARVRADFYQNTPNWEAFGEALQQSKNPICYNGDIFTLEDYERLVSSFPNLKAVMLGRGMISNPGLAEVLRNGESQKDYLVRLKAFHDELYGEYQHILSGDRNILFKMKELWHYMVNSFPNAQQHAKKLKKMKDCSEYEIYVRRLFAQYAAQ